MQRNSIKQLHSSTRIMKVVAAADFYLPDECWESIFKFLINDDNHSCLNSPSVVSKQFLSITNRLLFSLDVYNSTCLFFPRLLHRFSSINSLNLRCYQTDDVNTLLCQISLFPLNFKSLNLSNQPTIPANGLLVLSQNITTLISLTCSLIKSLHSTDLFLIAECFPYLEELDLSYPKELQNHESLLNGIEVLSSALFKLRKVNLTDHHYINDQSLFHLFKNWKLLEEAIIYCCQITNAGIAFALRERPTLRSLSISSYFEGEDCATLFAVSPQLNSLCFASSSWLEDESIKIFASIFPNLQLLDLSYCSYIPEEAICQILRSCSEIRQLNLALHSKIIKLRGMNFEVPKLEVLNLSRTRVDDEALYVISKSCRGLLQLLLERCCNVTEKGVKHVVENCTQLREINLMGCDKVHPSFVASMVLSRPSLRKIIAPARYCFSDRERELFLRQRCLVCYSWHSQTLLLKFKL